MPYQTKPWWGAPKRFADRKHERKISWLELFYDLVYVAAISQLTHHVADHPSWPVLAFSFLLFTLILWSWVNGSQYYDLHGSDGLRTRLMTFYQMLAAGAVAVSLNDAFEGHHRPFAFAFASLQIMITYMWWSVGLYDRDHRKYSRFYTINYLASFFIFIYSAYAHPAWVTPLWIVALLLNLSPPFLIIPTYRRERRTGEQVFSASAAIVERFGLFTIIVLAESVLGTVTGISEIEHRYAAAWTAFILCLFISFLLWSIYFDMTSEQETKPGYGNMQWLIFLHLPLLAALSSAGASLKNMLVHLESGLSSQIQWIICSSISVILLCVAALTLIMKEEEEDRSYINPVRRILVVIALIILLIPLLKFTSDVLVFLSVLAVILLIPVVIGFRSWIRWRFPT
jgi:low temperature requirement protein LtrA